MSATEIPVGRYTLDAGHSHIGFSVRHLVSKVRGHFTDFEGTVDVAENLGESSVTVEVRLASINTENHDRDGHLRSSDFFDVEQSPVMTFQSNEIVDNGDGEIKLRGDLTIRGVTRPLELDVEFLGAGPDPWGGTRLGFEASGHINRGDFGVDFNIPVSGDRVMIGDKVSLILTAQAVLQPAEAAVAEA